MLKGWKTLAVSMAVTVIGALQSLDWATLVTTDSAGYVLTGLGIAMAVLRLATDSPAGPAGPIPRD